MCCSMAALFSNGKPQMPHLYPHFSFAICVNVCSEADAVAGSACFENSIDS